jgi:hypothetical protein
VTLVDANSIKDVGINTDSIIQSRYADTLGVNPSDLNIDGGAYVDEFSSHAPQELVPGQMFDSLDLKVFSNVGLSSNDYAFRLFDNMLQDHSFYRISAASTTTLANALSITDSNIHVTNSSVLPIPNPTLAIPGFVFIGSEKIAYYTNDTTNNILGQIRRSVDGTAISNVHAVGSRIVDASETQLIPGVAMTTANITSTTNYAVTSNISLKLNFSSNVTANIGEYIVQKFANTTVAANLRVLGNVTAAKTVPVVKISGNLTARTGNTITINGNITANSYISNSVLGTINANGNVVISATASNYSLLQQTQAWYTTGTGTATDGTGLINSTTQQAVFLLNKPGYMP